MSNYIQPSSSSKLPGRPPLSLTQFIQTVMVGISNIPGQLVRPKWQIVPPTQPDLDVNWMAFGVSASVPDANAFIGVMQDGRIQTQRHETLEIGCSIYGPDAMEIAGLIRDGFQIPQNLESLRSASMGFVEVSPARHLPELINERFFNRVEMVVVLRREIQRVYPIVTILSATGTIHTVLGNEEYLLEWETET
jgi:hypothetical protein